MIELIILSLKVSDKIYDKLTSFRTYDVVMYGSSITAGCKWNKELFRLKIKNCGTNGYTTSHLIWFLNKKVLKYKPKICFIEGGINDIKTGIPLSLSYKNIESIVDTLIRHKIDPVLQSTLHVQYDGDYNTNLKIDSLNSFLSGLATKKDILYLDLNKLLSEKKRLRKDFTTDGTHINKRAYEIWINEIEISLNER
jgi:lysophospholipase L1-like esterase